MPVTIDVDAEIDSIRRKEQAADPGAPDATYFHDYFKESGLYWIDDASVVAGPIGTGLIPGGRLTLTTATPVTTADVTGAATLYYTPYISNMIELYDGARWIPVVFTEKSLSLAGYTASKPYDIWGYLSSGTLALDSTIWTDGTTRATALAYQDGRLIKNGATTRRYLGTIYINSSGAQTDDSITKRFVWNYYNREDRRLYDFDETSHQYSTGAYRSWNNDATIRVEFVYGVSEEPILVYCNGMQSGDADGRLAQSGIGLDVTNATTITSILVSTAQAILAGISMPIAPPAVGYHYLQAVERATSAAQNTFSGIYYGATVKG